MAKKTVATLQTGKEGRSYTKVIKMVKSPKTGAYIFDEQMVPNEKVQDFSRNNSVGRLMESSFHILWKELFYLQCYHHNTL